MNLHGRFEIEKCFSGTLHATWQEPHIPVGILCSRDLKGVGTYTGTGVELIYPCRDPIPRQLGIP